MTTTKLMFGFFNSTHFTSIKAEGKYIITFIREKKKKQKTKLKFISLLQTLKHKPSFG